MQQVALLRWDELRAAATTGASPWPFGSKQSAIAAFVRIWADNKMIKTNDNEGPGRQSICSLSCFMRLVSEQTAPPPNRTGDEFSECSYLVNATWQPLRRCPCETLALGDLLSSCIFPTTAQGRPVYANCPLNTDDPGAMPGRSWHGLAMLLAAAARMELTVALDNGQGRTPPMGTNDWNHYAKSLSIKY